MSDGKTKILELRDKGMTAKQITAELHNLGLKTVSGLTWKEGNVASVMARYKKTKAPRAKKASIATGAAQAISLGEATIARSLLQTKACIDGALFIADQRNIPETKRAAAMKLLLSDLN